MRTSYLALGVTLFLGGAILVDYLQPVAPPPMPPAGPIPLSCVRECLEGVIDQYLDAMASGEPADLPLSEDVRFSENDQMLEIGDGSWMTVTGRGDRAHVFADPEMGQVAAFATMEEAGGLVLIALRLRIELGRITEVETFTRRLGEDFAGFSQATGIGNIWFEVIPPTERPSRAEIIAVANARLEALQARRREDDRLFAPDCRRVENGVSIPCRESVASSVTLGSINQRRFPLVDTERGVVWAHSVQDHDPTLSPLGSPGSATGSPESFHAVEAYLIDGGLIRGIESTVFPAPYHSNSPWEGGLSGH